MKFVPGCAALEQAYSDTSLPDGLSSIRCRTDANASFAPLRAIVLCVVRPFRCACDEFLRNADSCSHRPYVMELVAAENVMLPAAPPKALPSLDELYNHYGRFVWAALARFGVAEKDLEDQLQEAFLVVYRQQAQFRGDATAQTWLFEICRRVASNYRQLASTRREKMASHEIPEAIAEGEGPERAAMAGEARQYVLAILDEMDADKRVVFMMFEIDLTPAAEIAKIVDVPIATVYSRLAAARKIFEKGAERYRALESARGCRW